MMEDPEDNMKDGTWIDIELTADDCVGDGAEHWKNGFFYWVFWLLGFFIFVDSCSKSPVLDTGLVEKRKIPIRMIEDFMYYVLETPDTPDSDYKKLLTDEFGHMNHCKWHNLWNLDNAKFKQEKRLLNKLSKEIIAVIVEAGANMANTPTSPFSKDDKIEWSNKEELLRHLFKVFERYLHHFKFQTVDRMKP